MKVEWERQGGSVSVLVDWKKVGWVYGDEVKHNYGNIFNVFKCGVTQAAIYGAEKHVCKAKCTVCGRELG